MARKRKRTVEASNLAWAEVFVIGKKEISTWSAADIAFATQFVTDATLDALTSLKGFVDGCMRYVIPKLNESACAPAVKRRQQMRADLGSHTRVVAALSLRAQARWQQLSVLVVEELAGYVQPPTFGVLRVVVPAGHFTGGWYCSAHGDAVYFGDETRRCLAVYRDGALQRGVGEGELSDARGSAVVGETVFVAHWEPDAVSVYPRAGGARLRRFDAPGCNGLAACGGLVYVTEFYDDRLSVFTESGTVVARVRCDDASGVDVDAGKVFVASASGGVAVFRINTVELERRIGGRRLKQAWDVAARDGALFVSTRAKRCILAFDVASGEQVAILRGFGGEPCGVAVRADGALFITIRDGSEHWRLCAVDPL